MEAARRGLGVEVDSERRKGRDALATACLGIILPQVKPNIRTKDATNGL